MKRTAGLLAMGVILAAVAAVPAQAQANGAATHTTTIWDGVYTVEQANRGKEIAQMNCAVCHSSSEWGSSAFMTRWSGDTVGHLHFHIKDNMPYEEPGRLTAKEYADIVAYMLQLNNVPAGEKELPSTTPELDVIQFTAQAPQGHAH